MTRTDRSSRLTVLVVTPKGFVGGAESWLLALLDATDRLDVTAILLEDGPLRSEFEARGHRVAVRPVGPTPWEITAGSAWLAGQLRQNRPDVVLGNGVKAQLLAAAPCALLGVPAVWAKHDYSYDRWLAPALGRLSTRVVATARQVGVATGRDDLVVVHPPAPQAPLPRETARAGLTARGLPAGDELLLAMVTRLIPYKGIDTAIEALALPAARSWRLVVMGDPDPASPDELDRLRTLAEERGLSGRVSFLGAVPAAGTLLSGVDAVAVLTRPDGRRTPGREGFSMAALEAMTAGVPVIAVDDGGSIVERLAGVAGIALRPADPPAVALALRRLSDQAVREGMGAAGRRQVVGHPNAAACADRLASVLADAARRPGAGLTGDRPISVVTTVLNEADAVDQLLSRLTTQLAPTDQVVVVDGGSADGTAERVRSWAATDSRVQLEERPGAGISAGRNAGVKAARHDLIACTDAGCDPEPGWLDAFRAAAAEREPASLMTGLYRAISRSGSVIDDAVAVVGYPDPDEARRLTPLVRAYGRLFGRTYDARLPTGRSVAFFREAWEAVAGFPEHLATAEDVLFGKTIVGTGRRAVLVTDAVVAWHQRPTFRSTMKMYYSYGRGGGLSRSPLLVGRDVTRAVAYVGAPLLAGRIRASRGPLALAAAAYLSLPVLRAGKRSRPAAVIAAVPFIAALRDGAKAIGCLHGLLDRAPSVPAQSQLIRSRPAAGGPASPDRQ